MQANLIQCTNLGMVRDKSISQLNPEQAEFAYDNRNIRITVNLDNTALSITNEKGTNQKFKFDGKLLGSCILNNQLILFINNSSNEESPDSIIKIIGDGKSYTYAELYTGNLNFNSEYPIETLGYYESEKVQKVYWVDGLNPNRFVNIASENISKTDNTLFDCKGTIHKIPQITITKDYSQLGNFPGGVILYFVTYYNKFGTETGIVWQSDLQYTSMIDRGCKESETSTCAFKLALSNIDTVNYQYVRIYATHRTSLNAQPLTYIVADLETSTLKNSGYYTDTGVGLQSFPTGDLSFVGGQEVIASTLALKDDTLFLGDITLPTTIIPEDSVLFESLRNFESKSYENNTIIIPNSCADISFTYKSIPTPTFENTYAYKNQLNESQADIAGFKYREVYRFGILFLTAKGEWTNPIYIGDRYCDKYPRKVISTYEIAQAQYTMNDAAKNALLLWNEDHPNNKFIQVRLLTAVLTPLDRRIVAQGVINPTMFNYTDRTQNKPYSINSWMFRPRQSNIINLHYDCMHEQSSEYAEIQGITEKPVPGFDPTDISLDTPNSYALLIGLSGDWITTHDVAYVLYKYANDGSVDFYEPTTDPEGNHVQIINDKQGRHNTLIGNPIVRIPEDPEGKKLNFNTKEKARLWLVENLAADLGMTDAMIPTAQELKDMARASLTTNNPDLVWSIVGASLATVASVVVTCLTFGAGAPLAGLGAAGVWSGVIAAIGTVGAAAGTAGVATLAKQLEEAPDVDKTFAKKGFYTLLPEFKHSLKNKQQFQTQYQNWLDSLFRKANENGEYIDEACEHSVEFIKYLNTGDNMATLIQLIGRTTFKTQKELDSEKKQNQYYIDESVVTLNSPDLEEALYIIDNSNALLLDLIGTIPIKAVQGDVSMYTATNGISEQATTLNKLVVQPYPSDTIEGLINGALYQDISLNNWDFDSSENKWPTEITPTVSVDSYKIFMWNRDTSWSCYIPGVNIINPISIAVNESTTKDYLNYIPAIPKKKVIANLRYSDNTCYENDIHTLTIESPHVFIQGYNGITPFYSNNTYRTYYGNVDALLLNTNGYTLLRGNNLPAWLQPEDESKYKHIYDPISIKFNSTSHAIIPLQWEDLILTILPIHSNEPSYKINDLYEISEDTIIEGMSSIYKNVTINFPIKETLYLNKKYPNIGTNITDTIEGLISKEILFDKTLKEKENKEDTNTIVIYEPTIASTQVAIPSLLDFKKNNMFVSFEEVVDGKQILYRKIDTFPCTITFDTYKKEICKLSFTVGVSYTISGSITEANTDILIAPTVEWNIDITVNEKKRHVNQAVLSLWNYKDNTPYLFLGELVKKDFNIDSWLGGTSPLALQLLTWNICSHATLINNNITNTWGDTYYQRWDCMKTFPTTEEDKNSVVDILSFMVETHNNIDGRCDVNRGVANLVNARPTNFNLFNNVYNQTDNLFQYKILDSKFEDNTQENQVVWSLTKNILDDIDKWTLINTVNYLNLNGTCGRLRKIINVGDVLLAFLDTGLSTIDYNQKAAVSTMEGVPVQLGNTNKVTGYTMVNDKIGCHNKWSINLNSTGLYFIDDYHKSLNRYSSQNGIESISTLQGFSQWFKDNITGTIWTPDDYSAFKLSFDELTKDLYIINDKESLVYNVDLNRFTSFMDYVKCPFIGNYLLKSIALYLDTELVILYNMFEGDYNNLLDKQVPYWMTYRLNPSPYTDNVFTNFSYIADIINSDKKVVDDSQLVDTTNLTFTSVEAWNEYQHGELNLTTPTGRHRRVQKKYRIWHGDIPRDGDKLDAKSYGSDRMRNPWLYLKLYKDTTGDTNKMVFHNLTVTYYK